MHSELLQSFLPVTLLLGSVFFGILMNRKESSRLEETIGRRFDDVDRRFVEVNRQFDEVNRRLSLIEADQKNFFTFTGKLDGRIVELSRRQSLYSA